MLCCPSLRKLFLKNVGGTLPEDVSPLTSLSCLTLVGAATAQMPESLGRLPNLESLVLQCDNQPVALPDSLSRLQRLRKLHLADSPLGNNPFPEVIFQLTSLEMLHLTGCSLTTLPSELCNLVQLRHLRLERNELEELPEALFDMQGLRFVDITENPNLLENSSEWSWRVLVNMCFKRGLEIAYDYTEVFEDEGQAVE